MPISDETFVDATMQNPANVVIIERLRCLRLPQCFLTAGCLFQTVWNLRSSRPARADIMDHDIFYSDDSDLSWDAEDAVIQQAKRFSAISKSRLKSKTKLGFICGTKIGLVAAIRGSGPRRTASIISSFPAPAWESI